MSDWSIFTNVWKRIPKHASTRFLMVANIFVDISNRLHLTGKTKKGGNRHVKKTPDWDNGEIAENEYGY